MRFLLLFALIIASFFSYSQQSSSIVGKWRVVAMSDNDMYLHFDKDSSAFSREFASNIKGGDSAGSIILAKMGMELLRNSSYIFQKDGKFKAIIPGLGSDESGSYSVNYAKGEITTTITQDKDKPKKEILLFKMLGATLQITFSSEDPPLVLYLERSDQR